MQSPAGPEHRPGGLRASARAVNMLGELGIPATPIEDHGMIVIAECARQHHLDLAAPRSLDQTVRERVVRVGVGPQQELALRAAASDQVELTGEHLLGQRHPCRRIKKSANPPPQDLTRLAPRTSERRPRVSELSEFRTITGHARLPSHSPPALIRPLQTTSVRVVPPTSATSPSTASSNEVLTAACPKEIEELEYACRS